MPGTGLYAVKDTPTKLDRTQDGAPVGQVITMTVGGLGTADAYKGGYIENLTRFEERAIVSHTDDTATLEGDLSNWLNTDDLDVYDSWNAVQDAFDQLSTDQAGTTFAAEQEIRLHAGTFTETMALNAALRPTDQFPLTIRANTDDSVTLANAAASVLDCNAVDSVHIESITFNGTGVGADDSEIDSPGRGCVISNCTFSGSCDNGVHNNGYGLLLEDCTFSGSHDVYSGRFHMPWVARMCTFRTKPVYAYREGMTYSAESCVFDGTFIQFQSDNDEPMAILGARNVHCIFYNAVQALLANVTAVGPTLSPYVRNCIFHTMTSAAFYSASAITFVRMDSDANCFYNCNAIAPNYATLSDWQALGDGAGNSPDADSIDVDPELVDPTNDDFSLEPTSPCRHAGHGSGVVCDYLGNEFHKNTPDIGAWSGEDSVSTVTWPSTLPQTVDQSSFMEGFADVVERSQMDSGPAKVRRRFTSGIQPFQATITMTVAQTATLQTFFKTTTMGGSLAFEWTHPRTGATARMRFIAPPTLSQPGPQHFVAMLALEILT